MAVQYDENIGFTTWLDTFKKKVFEVTPEIDNLFNKISQGTTQINKVKDFDHLFDVHKITEGREELEKFLKDSKYATKDLANYEQYLKDTAKATSSFAKFTKKAETAVKSLAASLASMAVMWAIGEVINWVVKGIDELIVTSKEMATSLSNSSLAFESSISDIQNLQNEIDTTSQRIQELQELSNNGKLSLVEKDELDHLKEVNYELERKKKLAEKEKKEKAKENAKDVQNLYSKAEEEVGTYSNNSSSTAGGGIHKEYKTFDNLISEYVATFEEELSKRTPDRNGLSKADISVLDGISQKIVDQFTKTITTDENGVEYTLSDLKEKLDGILESGEALTSEQQIIYDSISASEDAYFMHNYWLESTLENYKSLNEEQKRYILLNKLRDGGVVEEAQAEAIVNAIDTSDLDLFYQYPSPEFVPPNPSDFMTVEGYGKEYVRIWKNGIDEAIEEETPTIISFSDIFSLEDSEGNATALSNLKDNLNEITSSYQSLKTAMDEINTTGAVSFSTLERLIESGDDWVNYLTLENGQLKINEDSYYAMAQAKLHDLKIQSLRNLSDEVLKIQDLTSANDWLATQNLKTSDSYDTLAESIKNSTLAQLKSKLALADSTAEKKAIQNVIDTYSAQFEKITHLYDNVDISSMLSGSASTIADSLSKIKDTADLINTVSDELSESGDISVSTLQKIASEYPVLEQYVIDYIAGVEGSEENLKDRLNELYQEDLQNYRECYQLKANDSEDFWTSYVNQVADDIDTMAKNYGIDLKNYQNYANLMVEISNKIIESQNAIIKARQRVVGFATGDISTSAAVSGLSSDQKRIVINSWDSLVEDWFNEDKIVTVESIAKSLENQGFRTGLSQETAKKLHDILRTSKNDISSSYLDGLLKIEKNIAADFEKHSSEKANSTTFALNDPSKIGENSSSSKDTSKEFDWIEIALNNAQKALDKTKSKVDDTYSSWSQRNKDLSKAITDTTTAIGLQKQAYNAYMSEANNISFSGSERKYLDYVQKGYMNVEDIKNEDLAERISTYQTWYEKAQQCKEAENELNKSLQELNTTSKMDLIQGEFDNIYASIDSKMSTIQSLIDRAEMKGLFANDDYYDGMIALNQSKISELKREKDELQNILSAMNQSENTDIAAFQEVAMAIQEIDNEMFELENSTIEYNNSIRDLDWEVFKYLEDALSRITDETEFLTELLSKKNLFDKDTGKLTDNADATIALHAVNYDVYKQQAQDYYGEMQELQKQLVDGAGRDVLEYYNEIVDLHKDSILAAEQEKEAILDLIEEGLNAQKDAIQELIDKKKEQLSAEKSLYDYQKSIKQHTDEISSLEKQKLAYEGDDSEGAITKIQQIDVQLKEAREQLKETEMDKALDETQQMLDKITEDMELWISARLDNEDLLLSEIVGKVEEKGDAIHTTLESIATEYGTTLSDSLNTVFGTDTQFSNSLSNLKTGLDGISGSVSGVATAINDMKDKIVSLVVDDTKKASVTSKPSTNTSSNKSSTTNKTSATSSKPKTNTSTQSSGNSSANKSTSSAKDYSGIFIPKKDSYPKDKLQRTTSIVDALKYFDYDASFKARKKYYNALIDGSAYTGSAKQNVALLKKFREIQGFHTGGIVGELKTIIGKNGDDSLSINTLEKGEGIIPKDRMAQWDKLIQNLEPLNASVDLFKNVRIAPVIPNGSTRNSIINNDIKMDISLPDVRTPDDFIDAFQTNKRFEQLIGSMTGDMMKPGLNNSLNKYRY